MKKSIIFISFLMLASATWAGGSIFGGHKTRTSNPNGVSSVGIHICGNLDCPDVILKRGDCGTVEHAKVMYGVCVCDEGYKVEGEKCVPKGCDESEKVEKTYYIGACCTVPIAGNFCPEEEVPTCEKMDDVACAATNETECNNANGSWVCGDGSPFEEGCICAPEGAQTATAEFWPIACKPSEKTHCGQMACTCGHNEKSIACSNSKCISCTKDQVAECSLYTECICGPNDTAIDCGHWVCVSCKANQIAYCNDADECGCFCITNDNCAEGEYCRITDWDEYTPIRGVCESATSFEPLPENVTRTDYVYGGKKDGYSAYNWCSARKGLLIPPTDWSGFCVDDNVFCGGGSTTESAAWTRNGGSELVSLYDGQVFGNPPNGEYFALCNQ